jgi:hypothetical protein
MTALELSSDLLNIQMLTIQCRPRVELTPSTSYQRLLVHRCSAYYKLAQEPDGSKAIAIVPTVESRMYVFVALQFLMHLSTYILGLF